ncbi:MAG: hypothetical protein A4E19_15930 [Nitrospira sp. SG-bin1]|nr:MAG: hypothetical protein A4E19_15930 [Nitrospira sp. SG-bin1]
MNVVTHFHLAFMSVLRELGETYEETYPCATESDGTSSGCQRACLVNTLASDRLEFSEHIASD